VLVFATSDKGGTGRSVTSCNIAYHLSQRKNVAYLDFDFGSPTAGAIFETPKVERGVERDGLHSYVEGRTTDPRQIDVWTNTNRKDLREANTNAGRLVLFPGDKDGAEFSGPPDQVARHVQRCARLFSKLDQEFDVVFVDLSAGRSHAVQMALKATAEPQLREITSRWLVFHRWTRQHIVAAHSLVFEPRGLLDVGAAVGHDRQTLEDSIRFVRTAVPNVNSPLLTDRAAQATWLRACNEELKNLALRHKLGRSKTLGNTPMEPVLQWREQVISDVNVFDKVADAGTLDAFRQLAGKLTDDTVWEGL
jgi:hypothetical protein